MVKSQEKSSHIFDWVKVKSNQFEINPCVLHNKGLLSSAKDFTRAWMHVSLRIITQLQPSLAFLIHSRGERQETLVKVIAQGHSPTKWLIFNHKLIEHSPSHSPSLAPHWWGSHTITVHHSLKSYKAQTLFMTGSQGNQQRGTLKQEH